MATFRDRLIRDVNAPSHTILAKDATIDQLNERLNIILSHPTSFFHEALSTHVTYEYCNVWSLPPTFVLAYLIKNNFNFDQKYFDKFVNQMTNKGRMSWIVNSNDYIEERNKIFAELFKNFTPDNKQLNKFVNCYKHTKPERNPDIYFGWVVELLKTGVEISNEQLDILEDAGYKKLI